MRVSHGMCALLPWWRLSWRGMLRQVGDPQQLPATVLSSLATSANLAQSLFERLQRVRCALLLCPPPACKPGPVSI